MGLTKDLSITPQTERGKVFNSVVRSFCSSAHMVSRAGVEKDLQQHARDKAPLPTMRLLAMRRRISSNSKI